MRVALLLSKRTNQHLHQSEIENMTKEVVIGKVNAACSHTYSHLDISDLL